MRILEMARLADEHDEEKQQKLLLKIYINIAVCCIKLCMSRRVSILSLHSQRKIQQV